MRLVQRKAMTSTEPEARCPLGGGRWCGASACDRDTAPLVFRTVCMAVGSTCGLSQAELCPLKTQIEVLTPVPQIVTLPEMGSLPL